MAKKVSIQPKPAAAPVAADDWVYNRRAAEQPETPAAETMRRLTIDVPEELHRRIKARCAENGERMADVIRRLLDERFR